MGITPKNPADFDPSMGAYNDLRPFRFWCQKVLPLVYDDSLSYYEVLCKLVDYLNKTMEDVGILHDDVDALHTAYQQLQSYVNDYFSTLDVQQEIDNKLDVMAEDGTLDELLLPYFNAYKTEINGIVEEQTQNINSFETSVNDSISTQNGRISVLEGRMDTFSRLPEGSTTGDAELIDIRVGSNGITYNTAGDAVRAQAVQNPNSVLNLPETTTLENETFFPIYKLGVATKKVETYLIKQGISTLKRGIEYLAGGTVGTWMVGRITTNQETISVPPTPDEDFRREWNCCVLECKPSVLYYISAYSISTISMPYAFVDESGNVIEVANSYTIDKKIEAPQGAKYLVVNSVRTYDSLVIAGEAESVVAVDRNLDKYYLPVNGNLFDVSKGTDGYYLNGSQGVPVENSNFGYSDYIYTYGTTLLLENLGGNAVYFYDTDKNIIGFAPARDITEFPEQTQYIRFNYSVVTKNNVYVFLDERDASYRLPYGVQKILSADIYYQNAQDTINCGSTREIKTIKDAITEAESRIARGISPINIVLDAGTYDVFPSADLSSYSSTYEGLLLPNNCNLIGSGKDQTFIVGRLPADTSQYDFEPQLMSTLNIYFNNELKDVTVISKNCRYALHNDDFKSRALPNAVELFENVNFICEENDVGVATSMRAVGTGAYNGRKTKFINCIFTNYNLGKEPIILHNNVDSPLPCEWTLELCDFVGNSSSVAIGLSSAGSGQHEQVIFKGCDFDGGSIWFYRQTAYLGTENEMYVRGFGNTPVTYSWTGITEDLSTIHLIP